ncbi:hypothetical protein HDU96_004053 [Phlyctochytrium bullatum]|nr:hypothetical protein HDU96_004053 [Phlyctochytrium bullatum]
MNEKLWKTVLAIGVIIAIPLLVRRRRKKGGEPPTVPGYPLLGNPAFFRNRTEFVSKWRSRLGDFYQFRLASYRVFHVSGVALRQLFFNTENAKLNMTEGYKALHGAIPHVEDLVKQEYEGDGMKLTLFQRRLGMLLRDDRMREILPVIIDDMAKSMAEWGPSGTMDPFHNFFKLVFKLTVRMLGPSDVAADDNLLDELEDIYMTIEKSSSIVSNFIPWIPSVKRQQRDEANKKLFAFFSKYVDSRQNERNSDVIRPQKDVIDSLLDCGDNKYHIIQFMVGSLFAGKVPVTLMH